MADTALGVLIRIPKRWLLTHPGHPRHNWKTPMRPTAPPTLLRILSGPRGPEAAMSSMADDELARLLDALFRNLDTPAPEPSAIFWYEIGVEESLRRRH